MLTGKQIITDVKNGFITISDFNEKYIGPNSYDLHWSDKISRVIRNTDRCKTVRNTIDMLEEQKVETRDISEKGLLILPNQLYLISTKEIVGSNIYIPRIVGRSSIGRMGIQISQHADFGDIGFIGRWTLQVTVVNPTIIYPNLRVCHVYFEEPYGDTSIKYNGRYQGSIDATPSRFNL